MFAPPTIDPKPRSFGSSGTGTGGVESISSASAAMGSSLTGEKLTGDRGNIELGRRGGHLLTFREN